MSGEQTECQARWCHYQRKHEVPGKVMDGYFDAGIPFTAHLCGVHRNQVLRDSRYTITITLKSGKRFLADRTPRQEARDRVNNAKSALRSAQDEQDDILIRIGRAVLDGESTMELEEQARAMDAAVESAEAEVSAAERERARIEQEEGDDE